MPAPTASIQRVVEIDGSELTRRDRRRGSRACSSSTGSRCPTCSPSCSATRITNDVLEAADIEIGKKVEISTTSTRRRGPEAPDHRRGDLDRGRLRHPRRARGRPRLRQVAPPRGRPQDGDVPEHQVLGHRDHRSRTTPALTADIDDSGRDVRPRPPGEPVRPRLPVRARAPHRLRLPGRRRDAAVQEAGRVRRTRRARASFTSRTPDQLIWGDNLLEFRARMSAVAQVATVQVAGLGRHRQGGGHRRGGRQRDQRGARS